MLDARGNVARFAASGEQLLSVLDETQELAAAGGYGSSRSFLPPRAAALRARLVDVRRGEAVTLPEVMSEDADAETLAQAAATHIAREIDRRLNARIAVLGFPSSKHRTAASTFGNDVAEALMTQLRDAGYYDLMGPAATKKTLEKIGTSSLAVEYDPSIVKRRLACDYLIIGCVRGNVLEQSPPQGKLAGGDGEGNPGGDTAYTPTGKEPIE